MIHDVMSWWTGNITMGCIVDPMLSFWTRFNKVQQSPYIQEFRIGPRTKCGECPGETCHTHCIKVVLGEGHLACLPSIWSISPCLPPSSSAVVSHCKQLSGWLMSRPHKRTHRTCFEEWSGLAGAYPTCLWHMKTYRVQQGRQWPCKVNSQWIFGSHRHPPNAFGRGLKK